ncbi:hypothetical protein SLH46_13515 [Draconibacterium sp. IB214405]|uniref:hypothetical protein n=1 Tax=Draconibacterium sp. IB214405 TaxID=3097352 RepID=UPI002A115371|nr:hypothetical protein [Draconibacterium sp. IB214405]MDX8340212.1 hypothetical protein [Draconibacterium sp. IB214405]
MWRKREKKENTDFRKAIPEYSDKEIIAILKLRDHYQPEAAKLAVDEAIKRGIIHTEQDLLAEEFRCEPIKFSLFPDIKREKNRTKIRKSIARSLVLCSLFPVVFGLIELNRNNNLEGSVLLLFGFFWLFSASQLIRAFHLLFIRILFIQTMLAALFAGYKIFNKTTFVFLDSFILIVLCAFTFYGLLFMLKNLKE